MSTETEQFLAEMLPRQRVAEQAIHNGEVEPRLALWSRIDPVTVFGAKISASGWADLEPMFREVASWFSDSAGYEFEVIAAGASGDLAYTVGVRAQPGEGGRRTADLHVARHSRLPPRGRPVADRAPARRRSARGGWKDLRSRGRQWMRRLWTGYDEQRPASVPGDRP
jgi:hypothetical protein